MISPNSEILMFNKASVGKLEARQLFALFDALQTIDDVLSALCSHHRFSNSHGGFNEAGLLLGDLSDWLTNAKEDIATEARNRPILRQSKADAALIGWLKIRYEANFADSLSSLTAIAAEAAYDEVQANG